MLSFHRISNLLWKIHLKFLLDLSAIYQIINIYNHPAATIGHSFFIDHESVIGETSIIGNIYNVPANNTWWFNPSINSNLQRNVKRHPTLNDNVIIGSGAQILGQLL